jgi:hypothetical protein
VSTGNTLCTRCGEWVDPDHSCPTGSVAMDTARPTTEGRLAVAEAFHRAGQLCAVCENSSGSDCPGCGAESTTFGAGDAGMDAWHPGPTNIVDDLREANARVVARRHVHEPFPRSFMERIKRAMGWADGD